METSTSTDAPPCLKPSVETRPSESSSHMLVRASESRELEISHLEWEIAKLMDGARSPDQLVEAARDLGFPVAIDQVNRLIHRLLLYDVVTAGANPPLPRARSKIKPAIERFTSTVEVKPPPLAKTPPPLAKPNQESARALA